MSELCLKASWWWLDKLEKEPTLVSYVEGVLEIKIRTAKTILHDLSIVDQILYCN